LTCRPPFLALLLALLALVAAGCGDGDDEETTTSTTTTTAGASGATGEAGEEAGLLPSDVIAEGNEICAEGNEEIAQAFGQVDPNAKPAEIERVVTDEVVPNIQSQIDELRELDDSDELASVLDDAEETLGEIEDDPQLITSGDNPFADINEDLSELGLTACAE
jgi:hypothetical protein